MSRVLKTDTSERIEAAVLEAAALLGAGELVALPTETVYGLAANALDARAVQKIFAVKGRPAHNPIIVHVASLEMARHCADEWPDSAEKLARAFWPGPLTLVLRKAHFIPGVVTANGPTVGLRWPSHPVIQAVIRRCGFPLAAPSANLAGQVSPTRAEHVSRSFEDRIPLIVDGGPARVGIESTVLDLSVSPPRILRPGMIHAPSLVAVTGELDEAGLETGGALRSPGLLMKHYAPKTKLVVWRWSDETELLSRLAELRAPASRVHVIAHTRLPGRIGLGHVSALPHEPAAFARALYAELHASDEAGAQLIVVEAVPDRPEWRGISDRLARAAA